jgi:hypothetical protein
MKKSELKQIIREEIEKSISIHNFNPKDIYDFGGGDGPINPNVTVVDIEDNEWGDDEFGGEWVVADLTKFIKLPPKKIIHFSDSLNYFNGPGLVKTVHNALLPGGYIFHLGYSEDIHYLFQQLSKLGKYKAINFNPNSNKDDYEEEDYEEESYDYQIIKKYS